MAGMPSGAAGLDAGAHLAEYVNQNTLSSLPELTQENVEAAKKAEVQASTAWGDASNTLFDGILQGFADLGEFLTAVNHAITGAGGGFEDLADFFTVRWNDLALSLGIGSDALSSADQANIGVQILRAQLSGGVSGFDEFDYPADFSLPPALYEESSSGPGGGNYGPDGRGYLTWYGSGNGQREKILRRLDSTLDTDYGVVTAVWARRVIDPLGADGFGYLCGRFDNADNNTRVQARVDNNSARIQCVNAGVVTDIGSPVSVTTRDGDVWEFRYGNKVASDPYEFSLQQNGTTILTVNDSAMVSTYGAGYRQCGVGGRADVYLVFGQIFPPKLAGWTWADQ